MVLGLIILAITAILVLVLFDQIKDFGIEETHKEICKRQVQINAVSPELEPRIDCPVLERTIHGNPDLQSSKNAIARLMRDAREVYGIAWEGSDIFPAKSGVFCAPYALINFEQNNTYVKNLDKFLAETRYSPFSSETYMDYLTGQTAGTSGNLAQAIKVNTSLPTDRKYAVVFVYAKEYGNIKDLTNKIGEFATGGNNNFGLPSAFAGLQGQIVTSVGGGVLLGATAAIALYVAGVPVGLFLAGAAATGIVSGSALTAVVTEVTDEPKIAAEILLIPWTTQDGLKVLGCQYFPVSLGTRPQ